jgi:hypothetical protein
MRGAATGQERGTYLAAQSSELLSQPENSD